MRAQRAPERSLDAFPYCSLNVYVLQSSLAQGKHNCDSSLLVKPKLHPGCGKLDECRNDLVARLCCEMWEAVSFCLVLRVLKLPLCPLVNQCLSKEKGKLEKRGCI